MSSTSSGAPRGEWQRLPDNATSALLEGKPSEFQIDGQALRLAQERRINVETIRIHILCEAFRAWLDGLPRPGDPN